MRYFVSAILVLGLLVSFVEKVGAAEYFVAPAPVGSDGHTGTFDQPFATIQHGVDVLRPGDVLTINSGVYHEQVFLDVVGSASAPVLIRAADPEDRPVLDGEYTLPPADDPGGTIDGETYFARNSDQTPLLRLKGAEYVTIDGLQVTRSAGRGVQFWGGANNSLKNMTVWSIRDSCYHTYPLDGVEPSDNRLEQMEFYDCGNFAPFSRTTSQLDWPVAVNDSKAINTQMRHVSSHQNWGEGLNLGTGGSVSGCLLYDNYAASGVYIGHESDVLVENCLIYHSGNGYLRQGQITSGIWINNERGSTDPNNNLVFRNNILVQTRITVGGSQGSGVGNSHVQLYNNTIINPLAAPGEPTNAFNFSNQVPYQQFEIYNNLVVTSETVDPTRAIAGIEFGSNLWTTEPPSWVRGIGDVYAEAGLVNPLVRVNPGNVDPVEYSPLVSSLVIGAATGETPERDFFGCKRDSQPDIGAIEFGGRDCDRSVNPLPTGEPTSAPTVDPAGSGWEGVLVWLSNWGGDLKARLVN